jgi:hypothetical protein
LYSNSQLRTERSAQSIWLPTPPAFANSI